MEFDFRAGDIITHIDLPWSILVESQSSQQFHEVPVGATALVLNVEKLAPVPNETKYDKYKITMCADGVVGWSSERDYQWLRHWSVVARLEA